MSHTFKLGSFWQNLQNFLPPGAPVTAKFDENLGLSQASEQGDEMKISSGVSQSQGGDEQFVIVQYPSCGALTVLVHN